MSDIDWAPPEEDPPIEDEQEYKCPQCGRSFRSPQGVNLHVARVHTERAEPKERRPRTVRPDHPASVNLAQVRDELVSNLTTVGTLTSAIFPHTGLVIVTRAPDRDVPSADGESPRKVRGLASVIVDLAEKDRRVLRGVLAFNRMFVGGELLTLVGSLGSAMAVDARLLDPHLALMPGTPMEFRPVEMLIGDVVAQVEEMRPQVAEAVAPAGWEAPEEEE